jgi:hypothetical protein
MPSKGRANQMAERVGDLLKQKTPKGVKLAVYLAVESSDKETLAAAKKLPGVKLVKRHPGTTAVQGWNLAYKAAFADGADWFVLGADDIVWHDGWLGAALKTAKETGAQVVALNDGHTDLAQYGAHYMMTRQFSLEHLGGAFVPPRYKSWWFDRDICDLARSVGTYAPCEAAMAEHLHPEWKTADMDATYQDGYQHHGADHELYKWRSSVSWRVDYPPLVEEKQQPAPENKMIKVVENK